MELILILAIAAGLAFIPANIAQKKGYSFTLWWLYGWMLFIVAVIHIALLPDKNAERSIPQGSVADELKKYKELLECGALSQEEFDQKKKKLLNL